MKKLVLSLLPILMLGIGCTQNIEEDNNYGSVSGIVQDKTTGAPVAVVNLLLEPGGKSTVTGSDGTYMYKDLKPGVYTIHLSKEGYKDNTGKVTIAAGLQTEGDLLIERIPATMTVDKAELDFGADQTKNSLSFSLVNSDYATMYWNIGGYEPWISVDPVSGELPSGKTATVIVSIDRNSDKIKPGPNSSVIVIRSSSGHGSAEITVLVTGEEKEAPSVNILEATDIKSTSATLNGKIESPGIPAYTNGGERGFLLSGSKIDPDNAFTSPGIYKLSCKVNEDPQFSYNLSELTLNKTYYARAYVINRDNKVVSSNEIVFQPKATNPAVSVKKPTDLDISQGRAVLNGFVSNVGDPVYYEKGFVYANHTSPVIGNGTRVLAEGSGDGEYHVPVTGWDLDKTYYVRAYIKQRLNQDEQIYYSSETESLSLTTTTPTVTVSATTDKDIERRSAKLNGEVTYKGAPAYIEKGFVYSDTPSPTDLNTKIPVEGTGEGKFNVSLPNLEQNKTYYVRTYIKQRINQEEKTYYSSDTDMFSLETTSPTVVVYAATEKDVEHRSAKLNGEVTNKGIPVYIEKGFVYSDKPSPTVLDTKIPVEGNDEGKFYVSLPNLELDKTYYVRTYIKQRINQEEKVYYSNDTEQFILRTEEPKSRMVSIGELSYAGRQAKLSGEITYAGLPAYSKRGFVYGTNSNPVFENDKYEYVSGTTSAFSLYLGDLKTEQKYYARVFIEQNNKRYYSSNELDFILTPTAAKLSQVSISEIQYGSAKATSSVTEVGDPEYNERGFVYNKEGNPSVYSYDGKVVSSGSGKGAFSSRLGDLQSYTKYYVKAYLIQNGNVIYSQEEAFMTGKVDAVVSTSEVSEKQYTSAKLNGTIVKVGDPAYNKRGFYYGQNSNPTSSNSTVYVEDANSTGAFSLMINGLAEGATYYYRAYAMQPGIPDPVLGDTKEFTTGHKPNVTTGGVINITCTGNNEADLNWSATLYGGLSDPGDPAFTTFGFVYGTSPMPTKDDGVSVFITTTKYDTSGSTKIFNTTVSGFKTGTHYYIRAVATTPLGDIYGEPVEFTPTVIAPVLRTYSTQCEQVNGTWAVALVGVIASFGQPAATGMGFVYSESQMPAVGDPGAIAVSYTKIEKQGDYYVFGVGTSDISAGKNYYVRAYAKTALGYTYGEQLTFKTY